MIQAQELRIGNLVYYKNTEDFARVEIIHNKHFDCRDEYGSFTPNGSYEPIPLTEEILFKNTKLGIVFYLKGCEMQFVNGKLKGGFVDNEHGIEEGNQVELSYLHELQNWYYWNNNKVELEITL